MPRLDPPDSGVRARMYRPQGLGDCFLLAFPSTDGDARYVLVDCGVFNGTHGGSARMKIIAEDIREATGGRLDVLVVTHEHWDHLSGFSAARETFQALDVAEVWAAWTEDPSDPLAVRLQRERDESFGALVAAVGRMRDTALHAQADEIDGIVAFMGAQSPETRPLAPARFAADGRKVRGTAAQMDLALSLGARTRYLRPGDDPLSVADVPGVQVFVLGPPRDEAMLRRSDPRADEVYDLDHAGAPRAPRRDPADFLSALHDEDAQGPFAASAGVPLDAVPPPTPDPDGSTPVSVEDAALGQFFRTHYGTSDGGEGEGPAWRRIDGDWLGGAEALALQLDADTNNSSLALAFQLADGRVLLFPGDAQVGNWLSWHGVSWETKPGTTVTGTDLVRRTALYKVGHHASHNATLRDQGLELMERPDLVALVPVDESQAGQKNWAMPFPPLLQRLQAKCAGRVVRADRGLPTRPDGTTTAEWEAFIERTAEDPDGLWVQVDVPIS